MSAWWEINKPTQLGSGRGRERRTYVDMPNIDERTKEHFVVLSNLLNPGVTNKNKKAFIAMHGSNYNFYNNNMCRNQVPKTRLNASSSHFEREDWKSIDKLTAKVPDNVYVMYYSQINCFGALKNWKFVALCDVGIWCGFDRFLGSSRGIRDRLV